MGRNQQGAFGKLIRAAHALYEVEPNEDELDAFGFKPSDFADEEVGIWPDNWEAVQLFMALGTQWCMGMGGVVGLDYVAVKTVFDLHGIDPAQRLDLFADIQVMEHAALTEIYRNRK